MVDVRSLLRSERAARKISHPLAAYSTSGSLICTACNLQLKSESLWDGHLKSAKHVDYVLTSAAAPPSDQSSTISNGDGQSQRKRKAVEDEDEPDDGDIQRKKSRALRNTDTTQALDARQATSTISKSRLEEVAQSATKTSVDDDEWAAFEADIADTEAVESSAPDTDAIISAPAMTTAEIAQRSRVDETAARRSQREAQTEGEKEDAARRLDVELEDMEELEERVRTLKEKREALRKKTEAALSQRDAMLEPVRNGGEGNGEDNVDQDDDDDDDSDDDDDWNGYRLRS